MTMRVMIVCSSFPPVNATAVHRTVALCRRLAASGHGITVLTMPPAPRQDVDPALARRVPAGVRVIRTPPWFEPGRGRLALRSARRPPRLRETQPASAGVAAHGLSAVRSWFSDWLSMPDSRVGWLVPAVWSALCEARQSRPDVIYSTAPMWTAHLVGMCLSRLLDRPWVADCRDPWHANPFRAFRHAAHRRVDAWLEGRMVARAAFVICSTGPARDELACRYPAGAERIVAIPNGYDAEEIEAIRQSANCDSDGVCRFAHAGTFYGPRSPLPLMAAMTLLARRRPGLRSRVRLCLIGQDHYEGSSLADLAGRLGIQDMVEISGPLPRDEALRRVYEANVAVVCGHSGPAADLQIPRKFYEYVGLGKPTLVTSGTCRAVRQLLDGQEARSLWLADDTPRGLRGLYEVVEQIVLRWRDGQALGECRVELDLSAARMAERIESVLVQAAKAGEVQACSA